MPHFKTNLYITCLLLINLISGKIHQTQSETDKIPVGRRPGDGLSGRGLRKFGAHMADSRFVRGARR